MPAPPAGRTTASPSAGSACRRMSRRPSRTRRGRCSRSRCTGRSGRRWPRGSRPRPGPGCGRAASGGHHHAGGAEAALQAVLAMKPCWTGSSWPPCSQALDGAHLACRRPSRPAPCTTSPVCRRATPRRCRSWRCRSPSGCRSARGRRAGNGPAAAAARPRRCTRAPLTVMRDLHRQPPVPVRPGGGAAQRAVVSSPARCRL